MVEEIKDSAKRVLPGLRAWPEVLESVMDRMKISQGTKTSMGARQALSKMRSTDPLPSPSQPALPNTMVLTEGHRVACCLVGSGRRRASMPSLDTMGLSVPEWHERP